MGPTIEGLRSAIADPLADALDRVLAIDPGDEFDPLIPEGLVAAGLHRLPVPVAAGGLGATMVECAEVLAALGAVDGSTGLGFAMHLHSVGCIADSDAWPAATRDRVYASIVEASALYNNAATEEGGGSPARGAIPGTVAAPVEGGGWRLTGEKTWTTWLPALGRAFVTARIEDATSGDDPSVTIGIFLVDLDEPCVERLAGFEALGMRGSASGRLVLDGAVVPADALVVRRVAGGPDPRGPAPGAWFAISLAATYLGVGEGARATVARWALDRRPGDGSTPVADIPSVRIRLGRMDAALRVARIVTMDAARRWDGAKDRFAQLEVVPDLALAKITATNAAVAATDEAQRIAGGPGFLAGRLERAFRDARAGLINPPLDDVALAGFAATVLERERGHE